MAEMDNFSQQVQGGAQASAQQQMPLAMRAMAANPFNFGVSHLIGWNAQRYANTMFKGGVLDTAPGATGKRAAVKNFLGRRTGAYAGDAMQDNTNYAFGRSILGDDRSIFGKKPFGAGRKAKAQFANNPLNPATFFRFDSVARLAGAPGDPSVYSPFGTGMNFVAERILKGKGPIGAMARSRYPGKFDTATGDLLPGNEMYSGGLFGRINTMGKVMDYEKHVKAASNLTGSPSNYTRSQARIARRGEKAAAKLAKFDDSLIKLGRATGAQFATEAAEKVGRAAMGGAAGPVNVSSILKTGVADAEIGAAAQKIGRTRALSQTIRGFVPGGIFDSVATLGGRGSEMAGSAGFKKSSQIFAEAMEGSKFSRLGAGALDDAAHGAKSAMKIKTKMSGYMHHADNLLKSDDVALIRKTAGRLGMDAFARKEYKLAGKLAGQYAGTLGPMAGKALGAFGMASMTYDIGKGVGKMMMGGVNFGKDALKSMQGSMNKPLFGAGFKDNEVAATSRSRGVMAIQNSRLNARSSLGSEGAMMAAHFG
jgi:hypothetical protein